MHRLVARIASFYSVDLSGRWQATDALQLFGSVENRHGSHRAARSAHVRCGQLQPDGFGRSDRALLHAGIAVLVRSAMTQRRRRRSPPRRSKWRTLATSRSPAFFLFLFRFRTRRA